MLNDEQRKCSFYHVSLALKLNKYIIQSTANIYLPRIISEALIIVLPQILIAFI
jgi:hypothetical protein